MTETLTTLVDTTRTAWTPEAGPRPVRTHLWRPAGSGAARTDPAPTVLLSHGTGGSAASLAWLARPLAAAGFLVAAVDHHGNTAVEDYLPEGFAFGWERPRDLSLVLDHLVESGAADPDRTGAAGFSLGGYTVAALLGARVDAGVTLAVLTGAVPAPELPELPGLVAALRERYDEDELARLVAAGSGAVADPRVRSGFVLAPALGALVTAESLASVTAPLELRWGDADTVCPPESDAHVYLEGVPRARGRSVGPEVGHYVFLGDTDDPAGVRERVGGEAVAFFQETLGHP